MSRIATAALCHGHNRPFTHATVRLDDLREGEILVRIEACGICHTDMATRDGQLPVQFPAILGHEGAGVVEATGVSVTGLVPGDRVIMSFNSCGTCDNCEDNAPTYCLQFFPYNLMGGRPDGSATATLDGARVHAHFFGQSAFATHAIVSARNAIRVPDSAADLPLSTLAPIGCGLMTGAGAVLRSMQVRAGRAIAVFGTGTVGMAAIMAARIAGAHPIVAVDTNTARLEIASEMGATHVFNARDDAPARIRDLCPEGLPFIFDTTGIPAVIESAFDLLAPRGILGIVGASNLEDVLSFNERAFMGGGRRVMGILGGDSDLDGFLLELIDHHQAGRFPHDRLIRTFPFSQINEAIAASEDGSVVKAVLVMGDSS